MGRVLSGRYKLDRHIADGGMGAIWTADHLTLGVQVAIKLMKVDGANRADLRARFEQEAKAVAFLRDPHIVQVLDYGTDGDTPFIVMELLEGIDLMATLEHTRVWPPSEVAALVSQIASGLRSVHQLGLIHRDVKPANIFLARVGKGHEIIAKLIDFGIAKWTDSTANLTAADMVLGSTSYLSPEQILGHPLGVHADMWALSVVAFLLLTGSLPFAGRDGPETAKQIITGSRRRIAPPTKNALALERFFSRAFARDPGGRFESVDELARELILVTEVPSALKVAARAVAEVFGETREMAPPRENAAKRGAVVDPQTSEISTSEVEVVEVDPGDDTMELALAGRGATDWDAVEHLEDSTLTRPR